MIMRNASCHIVHAARSLPHPPALLTIHMHMIVLVELSIFDMMTTTCFICLVGSLTTLSNKARENPGIERVMLAKCQIFLGIHRYIWKGNLADSSKLL